MRLVDADVLVEIIDKHTMTDGALDDDIACILEQVPTAYDVDKVLDILNDYGKYKGVLIIGRDDSDNWIPVIEAKRIVREQKI